MCMNGNVNKCYELMNQMYIAYCRLRISSQVNEYVLIFSKRSIKSNFIDCHTTGVRIKFLKKK